MQPYFTPRRTFKPETADQSRMKRQPTSWFQFWNPRSSPTRPLPRAPTLSQMQPPMHKEDQPQAQEQQQPPSARTSPTKTTKKVPAATTPASASQELQPQKTTQAASTSDANPAAQAQHQPSPSARTSLTKTTKEVPAAIPPSSAPQELQPQKTTPVASTSDATPAAQAPHQQPSPTSQGAAAQGSPASSPSGLTRSRSRDAEAQRSPLMPPNGQKKTAAASQSPAKMSEKSTQPLDVTPHKKPVSTSVLPSSSKLPHETAVVTQEDKPQTHPSPENSLSLVQDGSQPQSQDKPPQPPSLPPPPPLLKLSSTNGKVINEIASHPMESDNKPMENVTKSLASLKSREETSPSERQKLEMVGEKTKENLPTEKISSNTNEIQEASRIADNANAHESCIVQSRHAGNDVTKPKGTETIPDKINEKPRIETNRQQSTKNSVDRSSMLEGSSNKQSTPSLRQGLNQVRETSKSANSETKPGSSSGDKLGIRKEPTTQINKPPQTTKTSNSLSVVPKPSKLPSIKISQSEQFEQPSRAQEKPSMQNVSTKKDGRGEVPVDAVASLPEEEQPSLHKDIKHGISRLVQNLAVGYPKQTGNEHDICIITLAGENKGASMIIGQKMPCTEDFFPIQRSYEGNQDAMAIDEINSMTKPDPKLDQAKCGAEHKVTINSNTQGINNSIFQNSSCCERDPGVHLNLTNKPDDPANLTVQQERPVTFKGGDMMQAKRTTYQPTVKRRCLRALFMESGESDPENPQKPRRHGCRFTCNDEKNKGIFDDTANI